MKHPRSKLDDKRRHVIVRSLKDSTPDDCAQAIRGCAKSDFHMARGQYRGQTPQHELSQILRSREKIEWFGAMAPQTASRGVDGDFTSSAEDATIRQAKRQVVLASQMAGSEDAKRKGDEGERRLFAEHGIKTVRGPDGRPRFEAADNPDP